MKKVMIDSAFIQINYYIIIVDENNQEISGILSFTNTNDTLC